MTLGGPALEYRRLRAPREDRSFVVEPPLAEAGVALAENQTRRAAYAYDVSGRTLAELGDQARSELVEAATRYTRSYRDAPSPRGKRVILAGHQPELFHPGVWCKNFALSALAARHEATAINLVVDSDTVKRTSLRVPGGTIAAPYVSDLPFDATATPIPYEERSVADWGLFESFGQRTRDEIRQLVPKPLVESFWPRVVERARERQRIGAALAEARHQLEGDWGLETLELPQSQVCCLSAFNWLVAHLLRELPRFRAVYNDGVREYRRVNHIRSHNHPVPDLAESAGWIEAPFWIWTTQAPHRRRLFVRQQGDALELTDRAAWRESIPARDGDPESTAAALRGLTCAKAKIRSRALVTTLVARLLFGDLFLHGIGGAKYDELTDLIIRRFFSVAPPCYMFLSATLHLPTPHAPVSSGDLRAVEQRIRELSFHPEVFLKGTNLGGEAKEQIDEKRKWIATPQTKENARQRCRTIRHANESLQSLLEDQREALLARRGALSERLRAESVLASREYSFCLYPEAPLRDFLTGIGAQA